jgi:hypothetical protein
MSWVFRLVLRFIAVLPCKTRSSLPLGTSEDDHRNTGFNPPLNTIHNRASAHAQTKTGTQPDPPQAARASLASFKASLSFFDRTSKSFLASAIRLSIRVLA